MSAVVVAVVVGGVGGGDSHSEGSYLERRPTQSKP